MSTKTRPCEICGAEIDPERIEAVPETRLCVEHARLVGKHGGEFVVTTTQASLGKSGSLKKNYGDVSVEAKAEHGGAAQAPRGVRTTSRGERRRGMTESLRLQLELPRRVNVLVRPIHDGDVRQHRFPDAPFAPAFVDVPEDDEFGCDGLDPGQQRRRPGVLGRRHARGTASP